MREAGLCKTERRRVRHRGGVAYQPAQTETAESAIRGDEVGAGGRDETTEARTTGDGTVAAAQWDQAEPGGRRHQNAGPTGHHRIVYLTLA